MNLGVETTQKRPAPGAPTPVSAFSDESWGGDPCDQNQPSTDLSFQHSLMNLGVETAVVRRQGFGCQAGFSIL